MSNINNESILESLFDEVCEEFPNNSEETNATIAYQRFEDLCQWLTQTVWLLTIIQTSWIVKKEYYKQWLNMTLNYIKKSSNIYRMIITTILFKLRHGN